MAEGFHQGRSFLTPAFEIYLGGQKLNSNASADILDITFSDDLETIPSFEFSIDDWDPIALRPKYSSPWDAFGNPLTDAKGDPLPVIEPGTQVDLFFGYRDEGTLTEIMQGEVVSISTAFPAAARPVAKVRALDRSQRSLQKIWIEGNFSGTDKQVVDLLVKASNEDPGAKKERPVTLVWAPIESEGSAKENVAVDGPLYDEILSRAKGYGLMLTGRSTETGYEIKLVRPGTDAKVPVATFEWGRTLVSFTPTISSAAAVEFVVVRGADPDQDGPKRGIVVTRTWADIRLDERLLGAPGKTGFTEATRGIREVIKPDNITTEDDAIKEGDAHLRRLAAKLITGAGVSIGLPELRAGQLIKIIGLGERFNGSYRLTRTTHSFGASGYTTSFDARKEVLA
jgi:uncharacterized protein